MLLRDLTIENYRSFEKYRLNNLARVNLLVGDNNCGKTSVLEAVRILVSYGKISTIFEQMEHRQDIARTNRTFGKYVTTSLFHSSPEVVEFDQQPSLTIATSGCDPTSGVEVSLSYFMERETGRKSFISDAESGNASVREEWLTIDEEGRDADYPTVSVSNAELAVAPHIFVPSHGVEVATLARIWKQLLRRRGESHAEDALRILNSDLGQIFFPPETETKRDILVELQGARSPLSEMGNGAYFLISLGASLAYSQHGTALVDEIDTGLHYSRLADMWRMVIQTAKDLDVQVFATTHSQDCIRALAEAVWREESLAPEIALHSIDRRMQESVRFGADELQVVVDQGIEVR